MINLSKTLARQLGPYNIRVNCITPGSIGAADPDGTKTIGFPMTKEEMEMDKQKSPLHEIGSPIDVANALLFLVSKRAKFITGVTLDVDGGKGMY
jgi:NAD(P)-dependent dehydrogenase (short-subunit alcohol dehydrogenase family)